MNARRVSSPPRLPGFEFIELVGSGGYADVFLYQQVAPRRLVAIKVVDNAGLSNRSATDFTDEANVMAMVSAHPHIVQVFQASVSPDGRPFLVMEYYPNQNFQERARSEQMSVAEVLRVGIQIASAVETAHRAGILHRDIKPANILTSEFHHPGLTDFGIAAVAGSDEQSGDGLSIPWSPPEALGEAPTLAQSDVYSLAATIYTMLAGRAPFEIKGGDNRPLAMMARIEREPVPPVGRADVPVMLERVLAGALAKDPFVRPATAAEFARHLQEVESSMQLPVTPLQLRDNTPIARSRGAEHVDHEATRVKNITAVHAQRSPVETTTTNKAGQPTTNAPISTNDRTTTRRPGTAAPPEITPAPTGRGHRGPVVGQPGPGVLGVKGLAPLPPHRPATNKTASHRASNLAASPPLTNPAATGPSVSTAASTHVESHVVVDRAREGLLPEPEVGDTLQRPQATTAELTEYEPPKKTPTLWKALGAVAVLILLVVVAMQIWGGKQGPTPADESSTVDAPPASIGVPADVALLPPTEVIGTPDPSGTNKFTWPPARGFVTYAITTDTDSTPVVVPEPEFETSETCIQVAVIAPSGRISDATRGCVN